jgi:hypothetical protein
MRENCKCIRRRETETNVMSEQLDYIVSQSQLFFLSILLLQNCVYPTEYEGHFDSLMISKDEIKEAVRSLANQIKADYKGCRPVMVCVLKGANPVRLSIKLKIVELVRWFRMLTLNSLSCICKSRSCLDSLNVSSISTYWMHCRTVGKGLTQNSSESPRTKERNQRVM